MFEQPSLPSPRRTQTWQPFPNSLQSGICCASDSKLLSVTPAGSFVCDTAGAHSVATTTVASMPKPTRTRFLGPATDQARPSAEQPLVDSAISQLQKPRLPSAK